MVLGTMATVYYILRYITHDDGGFDLAKQSLRTVFGYAMLETSLYLLFFPLKIEYDETYDCTVYNCDLTTYFINVILTLMFLLPALYLLYPQMSGKIPVSFTVASFAYYILFQTPGRVFFQWLILSCHPESGIVANIYVVADVAVISWLGVRLKVLGNLTPLDGALLLMKVLSVVSWRMIHPYLMHFY